MNKLYTFILFSLAIVAQLQAQNWVYNKHWVAFTDKNNSPFSLDKPEDFLSSKTIQRRQQFNIPVLLNDIPVNESYVNAVKNLGVKVIHTSKWMNAVTIETTDTLVLNSIRELAFVKSIEPVYRTEVLGKMNPDEATAIVRIAQQEAAIDYGNAFNQINMLHTDYLHNKGFKGNDVMIGVFDSGFSNADNVNGFTHLFNNGQIVFTYDFVESDFNVFDDDSHGTFVLSCMAAQIDNTLMGTAPAAQYVLFRTEDAPTEYRIEEDNWVVAAEKADSMGIDIINSSLGYSTFDDPLMSHTYDDMNGKTTRISRAAAIAASKGIIVVNSAGNSGNNSWRYITAPADADSILAVGAVNAERNIVGFSSRGPSKDGRVKPDVCAQGRDAIAMSPGNEIRSVNGTSFSSPILAGSVACFKQAFPEKSNTEIMNAVRQSASNYTSPNDSTGYGIPDFRKAYAQFKKESSFNTSLIYPNPFQNKLSLILFGFIDYKASIQVYDYYGKQIFSETITINENEFLDYTFSNTETWANGMYIVKISSPVESSTYKILKQ